MNVVKMFCSNGDKDYEAKEFGLCYEIIKSKYIYGSEEDIEKFKRYISYIGYFTALNNIVPKSEDIRKAKEEAVLEMKRIGSLYGLEIEGDNYDEINKKWFDHNDHFVGVKYFDKYVEARILHNKLVELEVD